MGHKKKPAAIAFLFENSAFLIAGALGALIWANLNPDSYHHFIHLDLSGSHHSAPAHDGALPAGDGHTDQGAGADHATDAPAEQPAGDDHAADGAPKTDTSQSSDGDHDGFTIHFLVNDILMALFFAIAGKEVWEALLPGGALSNPKKAATPLLATLGGVVGPALVYVVGVNLSGESTLTSGWAIPCATDIAFSYLVARIIFGPGHPAIAFLLLLAIADDAAGLVILAVFYPSKALAMEWMLLCLGAIAVGFSFRKLKLQSFWWYLLIPGIASWYAFYKAGIHPALGLVPIIPTMPHASTDLGIFARQELSRDDTLNEFEHWWKDPVELVLGLFGLVNAGVGFSSVGTGTWLVLGGLLIGKPVGITLFTWIAQKVFRLEIPGGMSYRHVVTLGMVAGIGFTVALFVSTAAFPASKFPSGMELDSVKMGALGSFGAAFIAIALGKMLRIQPYRGDDESPEGQAHH